MVWVMNNMKIYGTINKSVVSELFLVYYKFTWFFRLLNTKTKYSTRNGTEGRIFAKIKA